MNKHPTYEQLIFAALADLYRQHHSPNIHLNALYNFFSRNYLPQYSLSPRAWKSLVRKRIDLMSQRKLLIKLPNNYIRITNKRHFQGHTTEHSRNMRVQDVLPSPPATSPIRPYTPPYKDLPNSIGTESAPSTSNNDIIEAINQQKHALSTFKSEFLSSFQEDYSFEKDINVLQDLLGTRDVLYNRELRNSRAIIDNQRTNLLAIETENALYQSQLAQLKKLTQWQGSIVREQKEQLTTIKEKIRILYNSTTQ